MKSGWRAALRSAVIAAGFAVMVASLVEMRAAEWPTYLAFILLTAVLILPSVEVLPGLAMPIPEMAVTLGFLYIAGPPIIALRMLAPVLLLPLRWGVPARWQEWIPALRPEALAVRREPFVSAGRPGVPVNAGMLAEWATFALGQAARWTVVGALAPEAPPVANAAVIAVAEMAGYACWGVLSILPIYGKDGEYDTLLPLSSRLGLRAALADIFLIVVLALTPFVFLIWYGFHAHGLGGAVGWSLAGLGLHFMLRSLSERRLRLERQNQTLEALNRELEHRERLSAIGKMSSVVSHQILQQLGVIGIYADLIRNADRGPDPETAGAQVRANAAAIEGALADVNRVLEDLLVFSRDLRLNLYEQPLARVVEESLEDCRAHAAARGVTLHTAGTARVDVVLDKLKIKQALTNVIRNAIEASPAGGDVVVRTAVRDDGIEVAVSDRGPGVAPADRDAIFAPFFTTKEHGTGLGLAIARVFVEAHGGTLRVADPPEAGGATFVCRLPFKATQSGLAA